MFQFHFLLLLAVGCVSASASQSKVSYTFAVDDTNSMGNEIKAVRDGIKELLRIAPEAVANYVVVLFNDPTIGPWIKSNDNANITQFVDRIRPHGGGDCPEMAMAGLRKAVELSDRGSFIFFFSDASAKDYQLHPVVTKEAKAKDILILFVLTGCCSACNTVQFDAYKTVTNDTGGRMYQVSETGAEQFMKYTVVVAAKDALLIKYAPMNFKQIIDVGETGVVPTPFPITTTTTTKPTTTDPNNGCAQQTSYMTIASLLIVGLLLAAFWR